MAACFYSAPHSTNNIRAAHHVLLIIWKVQVSDWNPLTVWMYDESYVRFALSPYQTSNLADRFLEPELKHAIALTKPVNLDEC